MERVELKFCERCGALWLRPAVSGLIYCAGCTRLMAEMPAARLTKTKRTKRTNDSALSATSAPSASTDVVQ
jgi:hypothetical protein